MLSILVTGSNTAVGKTYCTSHLACYFAKQNKTVQIIKPVETGVTPDSLKDADKAKALALSRGAVSKTLEAITLNTFTLPLAAFSAAKADNKVLRFETLITQCFELPECDVRIYEGAGGIASPITEDNDDWADFASELDLDCVILVIKDELGAINQARLSSHRLSGSSIPHGVWLNEVTACNGAIQSSNREGLKQSGISLFAETKFDSKDAQFTAHFLTCISSNKIKKEVSFIGRIERDLKLRDQKKILRKLKVYKPSKKILNLSANDYLALSSDPQIIEATKNSLNFYGTSASASPLVSGWTKAHEDLVTTLCTWHKFSTGLIWSSGYAANVALLSTLPKVGDIIFADKLIHNSMIAGLKKSGATFKRYPHLDLDMLEVLLKSEASRNSVTNKRTVFVVTESVFSMDGDYPDLKKIASLKEKYPFIWILDEAHALGWYGLLGAGLAQKQGVTSFVDILVGTLGKTLASSGAYTLFHKDTISNYLINHAGEFIYSTALAPSNTAAATAAVSRVKSLVSEQNQWHTLSSQIRDRLTKLGFKTLLGESPIIPVFLDSEEAALSLKNVLQEAGILVAAIRPPTVPQGTSRIRISLKRGVTENDLNYLIEVMSRWKKENV